MILGADDTVGGVALAWDVAARSISFTHVQSGLFTGAKDYLQVYEFSAFVLHCGKDLRFGGEGGEGSALGTVSANNDKTLRLFKTHVKCTGNV